jgi:hypothetical protein
MLNLIFNSELLLCISIYVDTGSFAFENASYYVFKLSQKPPYHICNCAIPLMSLLGRTLLGYRRLRSDRETIMLLHFYLVPVLVWRGKLALSGV